MRSATAIKLQQIKVSGMLDYNVSFRPEFFLLVDLWNFCFRLRVGGTGEKKALKMTS